MFERLSRNSRDGLAGLCAEDAHGIFLALSPDDLVRVRAQVVPDSGRTI